MLRFLICKEKILESAFSSIRRSKVSVANCIFAILVFYSSRCRRVPDLSVYRIGRILSILDRKEEALDQLVYCVESLPFFWGPWEELLHLLDRDPNVMIPTFSLNSLLILVISFGQC